MRKSQLQGCIFLLFFLLFFVFSCGKQGEVVNVEADISAINNILDQYASSINAGNIDQWISLWAEDGIQMPPDNPAVVGKENIKARMQSSFDLYNWKMTINGEEVRVAGNWAFARGNYTYTLTPKGEGKTIKGNGKYLSILAKQADGSWKFIRDCFNNNAPPQVSEKN
ncbi:MAG: hypothetical protein B6D58_06730 [candidate division Zixibacteria bacterium 4484_95]|nr:MAG: hypothetical protein B6D58_06730 [candidate division Zixibacteria bacterium 4484_95]